MIMRTVRNGGKTTQQELANDVKVAGNTVTIGKTVCHSGLTSYGTRKVPLLKKFGTFMT